jgi:hypothetical protein
VLRSSGVSATQLGRSSGRRTWQWGWLVERGAKAVRGCGRGWDVVMWWEDERRATWQLVFKGPVHRTEKKTETGLNRTD